MGHSRFLVFYLVVGVLASMFYIHFSPGSLMPVIGASGAIAGVMGAYYVLFPRARILTFIPIFIIPWFIELPAVFFLGGGSCFSYFQAQLPKCFLLLAEALHGGVTSGVLSPGFCWCLFQKTVQAITLSDLD